MVTTKTTIAMNQLQHPQNQSAVLYASIDRTTVLVDIPASIAASCPLRLLSVEPLDAPHVLPEPKDPTVVFNQELLDTHNRLRDSVATALEKIRKDYGESNWCLERQIDANHANAPLSPFITRVFKSNLSLLQPPSGDPLELTELGPDTVFDITDIYQSVVRNSSPDFHRMVISVSANGTGTFIIPPRSSFLLAPVQTSIRIFTTYAASIGLFNFVLLDPPWPNRSAERCKAAYDTLPNVKDLLLLPIESALRDDGLVGVWVTNKPKWKQFVIQRLFPKWGVDFAGEWIWLKVTKSGEPIFDLESVMRKPYEILLFGRKPMRKDNVDHKWRRGNGGERLPSTNIEAQFGEGTGSSPGRLAVHAMPMKVIVAVPDLHSRKPCIQGKFLFQNSGACRFIYIGLPLNRPDKAVYAFGIYSLRNFWQTPGR